MTPLERAARDEVTAFLDAQDRHVHGHMPVATTHNPDGTVRTLEREDLRLVLAALDRHETPASVERCPLCGGDAAGDALAPLCEGAPHGRSGKSEASAPRPQGRYSAVLDGDTVHIRRALCPDWQLASYPGGLDGHEAEVVEAARVHGQERHGGSDDG